MAETVTAERPAEADGPAIRTAASRLANSASAIAEIARSIADVRLGGAILFCGARHDRAQLATAIGETFPGIPVIGCTSSGELNDRGYDENSLTFIGFPAEAFHMASACFDDIDRFDQQSASAAIRDLSAHAELESSRLGPRLHRVALFLVDGLSHREELLSMTLQDALGDVPLIGGSSGDNLMFHETGIFHHGRFHRDSAVVAILSTPRPMRVFRSQHYAPGRNRMVVTGAVAEDRRVTEINAEPAAREYLRLAGRPGDTLDLAFFAAHPLMVRAGGEYHVRSVQSANPDGSLTFYCAIDEGLVMTLGEPVDRLAHSARLFERLEGEIGSIDRIIAFDCVLNRIDAEQRQLARDVSSLYAGNRVIGFSTYGEQFRAAHVNQTFTGLAIGR